MDNPVPVALKLGPDVARLFRNPPTLGFRTENRMRGQKKLLLFLKTFSDIHRLYPIKKKEFTKVLL